MEYAPESIEIQAAIIETLAKELQKIPISYTSSLFDYYFEDIYTMLMRRFSDRLEPPIIRLAAEHYLHKTLDIRTYKPKISVHSPVGLFYDAYLDALQSWKAARYREAK